jgi:hypothetical protein
MIQQLQALANQKHKAREEIADKAIIGSTLMNTRAVVASVDISHLFNHSVTMATCHSNPPQ